MNPWLRAVHLGDRGAASIRDWIAPDDPRAADTVKARILQTAMMLGQFPMLGRPRQVTETREFSVVGLPDVIV